MHFIVKNLLKIDTRDHFEIQKQIKSMLEGFGYYVKTEKQVARAKNEGRIDVFASKNNYWVGIEIDHSSIRLNSIDKLNALRPNLAVFILKARKIDYKKNFVKTGLLNVKSVIIHLHSGKIKWYLPEKRLFSPWMSREDNLEFKRKQETGSVEKSS